jgi:hypothetical protein
VQKPTEPRPCDARRCACCRYTDARGEHVRPLTPAELAWQFGDAEAALGVRSTHGAFVDMAQSGIQSGGRTNGVEERLVRFVRLAGESGFDPVARHRCIRRRLERAAVPPDQLEVLRAAFSPEDWTRAITDPDIRNAVEGALLGVPGEVVRVLPLTETARTYAARRQAPKASSSSPVVVSGPLRAIDGGQDRETGVRCAFRPAAPPPKAKKSGPSDPGNATLAEKLRRHLREQPGLAGTARGFVMTILLGSDLKATARLIGAGRQLVEHARAAAGVVDPPRSRRARSVQLVPATRAAPMEPPYIPCDAEVLACG